jgi:hypothetical protein
MSGPKRNPDKLNTIGVVVVGICGAVLVYVSIVALQAFYMGDTSEIQTMADYGGQDLTAKGRRADEMRNITEAGKNAVAPDQQPTFRIPIEHAMKLVTEGAKTDPTHLIPALPPSTKASIEPVFGRPKSAVPPAPAPGAAPAGAADPGAPGTAPPAAPTAPTGAAGQPQPVPGAGGVPAGTQPAAGTTAPAAGAPTPKAPAPGAAPKAPAPKSPAAQPKAPAQPKPAAPAATQPKAPAPAPAPAPAATQPKAPAPAPPKNP